MKKLSKYFILAIIIPWIGIGVIWFLSDTKPGISLYCKFIVNRWLNSNGSLEKDLELLNIDKNVVFNYWHQICIRNELGQANIFMGSDL